MNTDLNILIRHFFDRSDISKLSESDIRQFLSDHPYSVAGQVLLAKKMQQAGHHSYIQQANASALYVHDPLWLQFLLNATSEQDAIEKEHQFSEAVAATINENPSPASSESFFAEHVDATEEQATNGIDDQLANDIAGESVAEHSFTDTEEIANKSPDIESGSQPEPVIVGDATPAETSSDPAGAEAEIPVEPYHTVDYFASQGIKLQQAELGKDKLGQQVKSFTEWLRSMKRLPQATMEAQVDPVAEQSVNRIAEHSLEDKEVLTEAMAEVWKKQGNKQKAIEIYNKLSLQNPGKSAYFAAKIEQLKS